MNGTRSGQALLLGVMILGVLLVAFSAILFLNRTVTQHSVKSQLKLKGRSVAEEGLSYALQQLTTPGTPPPNWPYFSATGLLAPETVTSVQGNSFTVTYSSISAGTVNSPLQSYEVGVTARPLNASGKIIPGSSLFAEISQKTVGVKLSNGLSAWAALELNHAPLVTAGSLVVYNGPIVNHGNETWNLDTWSDGCRMPRKFSAGAITGTILPAPDRAPDTTAPLTDQQEYWAFSSPGFVSTINQYALPAATSYAGLAAMSSHCATQPKCEGQCNSNLVYGAAPPGPGGLIPACTAPVCTIPGGVPVPGNCYFQVAQGDTALFDAGYTLNQPNAVLYVAGSAEFDQIHIDVEPAGAVIVDSLSPGLLTLGDNAAPPAGTTNTPATPMPLPPTCKLEGPYNAPTATCGPDPAPCSANANGCCSSTSTPHRIDLYGFLYVTGDLNIAANNRWWAIDGVVRVDGQFTQSSGNLQITGSDIVNHNILTSNFEVQVDSITAIP